MYTYSCTCIFPYFLAYYAKPLAKDSKNIHAHQKFWWSPARALGPPGARPRGRNTIQSILFWLCFGGPRGR